MRRTTVGQHLDSEGMEEMPDQQGVPSPDGPLPEPDGEPEDHQKMVPRTPERTDR